MILIVEDEEDISKLIAVTLSKSYSVKQFFNGNDFINFLDNYSKNDISLIIFDIMLPDYSGIELCKIVRKYSNYKEIPIIILTAKQSERDRLNGFEAGADDYVTKPFFPNELLARVKAILKRTKSNKENSESDTNIIDVNGEIFIDKDRFIVYDKDKNEFKLTTAEYKILELLASNRGYPYSRDKIIDSVFGSNYYVIDRTIDVHITHIRNKIVYLKDFIENVRGIGYKFKD
jgi:DNA-binding response OmpR family regulator